MVANAPVATVGRMQRTLKNPVEYRGVGLHSGKEIRIVVRPAEAGTGVSFVRTDIDDHPVVRAQGSNMKARQRRTCIQDGRAEVYTCEHLLAALYALGIDNAIVEIDGEEVPGLDGAAGEFLRGLREAGAVETRAPRAIYQVKQPIYVREGAASLVALPGTGKLTIEYHLDYPAQKNGAAGAPGGADQAGNGSVPAHKQIVGFELTADNFEREIAPARTFVFAHEVEALRAAGLGKGANPQNTLVVGPDGPQASLRWDDELARHKILDLIGDLANAGVDLDAHIIATRSGHGLNMQLVHRILEEREREQEQGEVPSDTGLDIRQILKLLPHRYPFLLIDRVIELDGFQRAVAIKNVTINEPFFQGHWPEQPIMPGVLQLEAMAQLAGVLLLRKLENTGKLAVLWSIDKVKLRGAVVPGDQVRIEVETIRAKPQVGHVRARCKVGGRLVAEAELKFTLVDA
ncbi:MAG: 3-hydroxyacyl-ACP dehydratase FabZ [Planctomycetes bacterium]|nr:3-hydroxyacyl-ACP dehydratase FabZ [Planctomycetota bacterium]MCC7398831.1 3-hydroxyacyl-ACP dehydratase FabZ [Planctomycetota bacterium]